jgi:uncharacterized glyoxalase superfamily metalloenzyme YdcJ
MNNPLYHPASQIRARFATAMSQMYRQEVPLYGELVTLVEDINRAVLQQNPALRDAMQKSGALQRLSDERHGAIRLGGAAELATMRRLFAVMGMYPVSYYDLSVAGIPVHSTAFRPLEIDELNRNPFRIFTSLLRLDLITDENLRTRAKDILQQRQIFTPGVLELIESFEQQQGLSAAQAESFVEEALETFRWHHQATVDFDTYQKFLEAHRLIADIVCFRGPHINHLTPRTLDIDAAQQQMGAKNMHPKAIVEGPPKRENPILLRQTSFRALDEEIQFAQQNSEATNGFHTARFGEIEQRGMALTPKGRELYDRLLTEVRQAQPDAVNHPGAYVAQLQKTFCQFPDNLHQLRHQQLGYFRYLPGDNALKTNEDDDLNVLIERGMILLTPITYEDFLPVSAAGIFQSNLKQGETGDFERSPNQQQFEQDLGCKVIDEFAWYEKIQRQSLIDTLSASDLSFEYQQRLLAQL